MLPATEIDKELVQWAHENLPNLPQSTYYEKQISGMLVKPKWSSIVHETKMKQLVKDYDSINLNHFSSAKQYHEARTSFIQTHLLGKTGERVYLESPVHINYGYNIAVGENFYCNFNCTFLDWSIIKIGNNVAIGPNCTLSCINHPLDGDDRMKNAGMYAFPIIIDDNVWIGANSVILSKVHIAEGSVVAAGSIVTKSVPPHVIVAGNPAKIIAKSKSRPLQAATEEPSSPEASDAEESYMFINRTADP